MAALVRTCSSGVLKCINIQKCSVRLVSGDRRKSGVKSSIPKGSRSAIASHKLGEFVIPMKIKRGPTDILEALAGTVSRDYTAAHYKFEDDPFLIPVSNAAKRTFALSKESGRKSARWIRDTYPDYIAEGDDAPRIPLFSPKKTFTMESDVSIDILLGCISTVDVPNAIVVYKNLLSKGIEIDADTRQQLLELLCFFNCESAPDADFIEDIWFRKRASKNVRESWRGGKLVDDLFNSIEPKTSRAFSAIIRGLGKNSQSERAWTLFKEMQEKGLPINVDIYNSILQQVCFLRESAESRWELSLSLLMEMNQIGLKPNLGTLNTVLENFNYLGSWTETKKLTLQLLAEMKQLGIEPSLGSYHFLLLIFCRQRGPVSTILYDIMNQLIGREFSIRHPKDAMDVCHTHLGDMDLALKVDSLLHTGSNHYLIGDSIKEAIYYQHFFALLAETESVDTVFEYYNKLVPNIYTPEPSVMLKMIHAIEDSCALQYVPQIWSDLVSFEHHLRENLLETLINVMVNGDPIDEKIRAQFAVIALHIQELVDGQRTDRIMTQVQWTGQMLGNLTLLLLRGDKYDDAWNLLEKYQNKRDRISGPLSIEAFELFIKTAMEKGKTSHAVACNILMADAGYMQAVDYAKEIITNMETNDQEKTLMDDIISLKVDE